MSTLPAIDLPIREHDGEPRVLDTDLGAALGMARPRKIRELIERHADTLTEFGALAPRRGKSRGQEFTEYALNEEPAIYITTQSDAPNARAVKVQVVKVFVAWRHGHLAPAAATPAHIGRIVAAVTDRQLRGVDGKVTDLATQIEALRTFVADLSVTVDRTRSATDFVRALDVAVQEGVPSKRRGGLVRSISARLRSYSATVGYPLRRSSETRTWLFHVDAVNAWLRAEGAAMIRDHKARQIGQGVIRFPTGGRAS